MKKPIHPLLLLLPCLLLLVGCGKQQPRYHIGISQCSDDAWREQMNREMQRETTFYPFGVSLDFRQGANRSDLQVKQIDSLIEENVDLLIVSPNESEVVGPAIERAYKRGIPVVLVDRRIASNNFNAFVGADNRSIGSDAASLVAQELNGEGTVVEVTGLWGSTAARERHLGFEAGLQNQSGIRLLSFVESDWEGKNAARKLDSLIKVGIRPDMIFAHNDAIGLRLRQEAHRHDLPIKIIGIDALPGKGGGLEAVEKGLLTASLVYPTGGDKVMQTALQILEQQPYQRETKLNSAIVNPTTARIFRMQTDQVAQKETRIDQLSSQLDQFLRRFSMQKILLISAVITILLIAALLAFALRMYFITQRRNEELARQKQKLEAQRDQLVSLSKQLEETTQSKLTFFTDVSHDLRTPLTLILAPVEQLISAHNLNAEQVNLLHVIRANADILMRLVSQTLDFRKFESGQLKLNLCPLTINEAMEGWCAPFRALGRKKMIRFHLETLKLPTFPANDPSDPAETDALKAGMAMLDSQKMESILYNLLSNAFKFTPEGGLVSVKLEARLDEKNQRRLRLTVEDSGTGIPAEKLPHIFDRYYQADATHQGSGIGLTTVKTYVEVHKGTIHAESTATSKGTRFVIELPYLLPHHKEEHTNSNEIVFQKPITPEDQIHNILRESQTIPHHAVTSAEVAHAATTHADSAATTGETEGDEQNRQTILIIDDNDDIRAYVRILIGDEYHIEEAVNGQDGLAKARQFMPDAIICDILMPVMDGWETCRRIKEEWQTSHIPVMLLTACALDEQRIQGFDCGADAYVAKPFNPELFRSRLRNLITNRHRVKTFFGDKTMIASSNVSELDKTFSERFRELIEAHLTDSEISVDDLAVEMGLGRSQLYRKVKALTGYSPGELLRIARLKKGAELLTRTERNVSEIAYDVGFSSPTYFTRCFREYFGVNPTEYAKGKSGK